MQNYFFAMQNPTFCNAKSKFLHGWNCSENQKIYPKTTPHPAKKRGLGSLGSPGEPPSLFGRVGRCYSLILDGGRMLCFDLGLNFGLFDFWGFGQKIIFLVNTRTGGTGNRRPQEPNRTEPNRWLPVQRSSYHQSVRDFAILHLGRVPGCQDAILIEFLTFWFYLEN